MNLPAASSRKDFVNKMSIASKEARESYYWLKLLKEGQMVNPGVDDHIEDIRNIINVLTAIVKTTKRSLMEQG
ncbi:MAG: four helix bundle protein [Bacteroidales bacterium]|nr:four helix bundle protein [Bacteroidales bacterium]